MRGGSATLTYMRSRYVVEVVEEKKPQPAPQHPAQPASAQPPVVHPTPVIDPPYSAPPSTGVTPSQAKSSPPGKSTHIFEKKHSSVTAFVSQPLNAKLNARIEIPSAVPQVQQAPNSGGVNPNESPKEVPDLFEAAQPSVQQAWQQIQLSAAHEVPSVRPPHSTKSRKVAPEVVRSKHTTTSQNSDRLDRIERLFSDQLSSSRSDSLQAINQSSSRSQKRGLPGRKKTPKWLVILIVSGLFILGSSAAAIAAVQFDISQARVLAADLSRSVEEGNLDQAQKTISQLEKKQQRYKTLYTFTRPVITPFLSTQKVTNIDTLWDVSDRGLEVANQVFETHNTAAIAYSQFIGSSPGSALATTASLSGQLESVYSGLSGLQAEVAGLDNPFNWDAIDTLKEVSQEKLPSVRRSLLATQQLIPTLPNLLGADGRKEYLILLQNNSELRPTGGFIGSLGILTVENGRFIDFRVEDVYEVDGQLNGFVQPPAELQKHLGEAQWYLRDVNWSPDFPTVAEQAGWFLDKTIGVKPDGVIAINLSVAQELLKATGPITLVDYNEVITAENLYERAQLHSEVNFFPGSSQKKDFLSAVATALFQKLTEGEGSIAKFMPAFYQSAQESQILVSTKDPLAASVFRALGWDGGVLSPECPQPFSQGVCVVDTVMQVEANVGVNKANQFVQRDIRHVADISDDQVTHTRTITLENTSQSNAWPQGSYKAYFRLFASPRASLSSISIDGQIVPISEITEQQEFGKQVFGVLVNVPVRTAAKVEIVYTVPLDAGWSSYALFEQKQSGTGARAGADLLTHELNVSSSGRVTTVAPQPVNDPMVSDSAGGSSFIFESDRQTHEFMAVEVTR